MSRRSVAYSILSVSVLGIVAKILGLLREGVVAAFFGTSAQMDVFSLLSSLMTTFITIIGSSLSVAYMPTFIENDRVQGASFASRKLSGLMNQYIVFSFLFYVFLFVISPMIPKFIGNKVVGVPDKTIILYSRILFSTIILSGLSRIQVAALNGLRRFGWMQITTGLYSVISIIMTIIWGKKYGVGVLVASYIVYSVIQVVVLHLVLFRGDYHYIARCEFKDKQSLDAWRSFIPVFLGTETYLLGLTIDRTIGLSLGEEGIASAFNYAGLLYGLLNTIIATPIVTVFYTELSGKYVDSGLEGLYDELRKTINDLSVILIPVAFFLCIDSLDFVTVVLQRGAFDTHSSWITAQAFMLYALASPIYAFRSLFARVFIVIKDRKTPMISGVIFIFANIVSGILFARVFGILGITLGSFIAMTLSFLYLYFVLRIKYGYRYRVLSRSIMLFVLASIIAGSVLFLITKATASFSVYVRFILCAMLYFVTYFLLLSFFKIKEIDFIKKKFNTVIEKTGLYKNN